MPYHIKKAKGKDGFYVYGVDGKRHSKSPMTLEMAKKQMSALNIAHAKKEGKVISVPTKVRKHKVKISHHPAEHPIVKDKETHSAEHPIVKKSKMIEKAVEVASMAGKHGMHSPAGVLAPAVSETTGGGSGLANDAHWVSAVHKGGRASHVEKTEHMVGKGKAEKVEHKEGKMTTKEKQMAYMQYYREGKMPGDVPPHLKRGYTTYHKKVMRGEPPKWHKD
jgi:hypothetical protein